MSFINIVLADDHEIVRQGLRVLLEAEDKFQVVGEAANGIEATQLVENLQPDVLVTDLMMPGLNGMEVARTVSQQLPKIRIIILSMHDSEGYITEALRNGAAGYVLKKNSAADLVKAVYEVAAGHRYLSPSLSERALEAYIQYIQQVKDPNIDPYETLTIREREVLQLSAEGHTSGDIADRLSISRRTAEVHRANMLRKLGLRSKTDLIRYAMQNGILPM